MDFIPEKSALEVDEIRMDKEAMGTLAFTIRRQRSKHGGCRRRRGRRNPASHRGG
jgi:hypothetical protein